MTLNLAKAVIGYLKDRPEQKFTARQIAEWVFASYPDECQEKRANSRGDYIKSDADLVQQLVAEISSQRPRMQTKHPGLKTTEGRPRRYYFSERSDSAEVAAAESEGTSTTADASILKIDEHALYPLLSQYLWEEFGVFSKRIDEKRSSNKRGPNGNRWLYPDVVGMEDLGADWHQEVRDCVNQYSDKRTKLWSFEAKLLINRSNVRECFFSGSVEFFVGQLWLSGDGGNRRHRYSKGTADVVRRPRHRFHQAGRGQPCRQSGSDTGPRA